MAGNLKYKLQKHRTKLLMAGSIVLFLAAGIALYFLLSHDGWDIFKLGPSKNTLAKSVISANEDGTLAVIDTKTKEKTSTFTLPNGNYLYTPNASYDGLYAYDGTRIYQLSLQNGKIKNNGDIAKISVEGAESFRTDGKNVAILSEEGQKLTYHYQIGGNWSTKVFNLPDSVRDYAVIDGHLYYATGTTLHLFSPKKETSIDLGDVTDCITRFQDKILIHNRFGSGLGNSILLTLNPSDLSITELEGNLSADTNLIPADSGDKTFYTVQYVDGTDPYHLINEWKMKNGRLNRNENQPVKIPLTEDGILYNQNTTVASKGYLYVHFKNRLNIFDIHSQKWLESITGVSDEFAMPVLVN